MNNKNKHICGANVKRVEAEPGDEFLLLNKLYFILKKINK